MSQDQDKPRTRGALETEIAGMLTNELFDMALNVRDDEIRLEVIKMIMDLAEPELQRRLDSGEAS